MQHTAQFPNVRSYLFHVPLDQTVGPSVTFTNEVSLTKWTILVRRANQITRNMCDPKVIKDEATVWSEGSRNKYDSDCLKLSEIANI